MISIFACAWGGKPDCGAISSSFQTRTAPQPMRVASWYSAKEKWCLAFNHPRSIAPIVANRLTSIMGMFPAGRFRPLYGAPWRRQKRRAAGATPQRAPSAIRRYGVELTLGTLARYRYPASQSVRERVGSAFLRRFSGCIAFFPPIALLLARRPRAPTWDLPSASC